MLIAPEGGDYGGEGYNWSTKPTVLGFGSIL